MIIAYILFVLVPNISGLPFYVFEDDIAITVSPEQFIRRQIYMRTLGMFNHGRVKRNVIRDASLRWPDKQLPYYFDPNYFDEFNDNPRVKLIKQAMEFLEKETCIKFIPKQDTHKKYLNITADFDVCTSPVGNSEPEGRHEVRLGGCSMCVQSFVHELLHSLGLYHEQSRSDRDQHVEVVWDETYNVLNFQKYTSEWIDHYNLPYDYCSVMHYPSKSGFAHCALPLIPLKEGVKEIQSSCDLPHFASPHDLYKVNRLYECTAKIIKPDPVTAYSCQKDYTRKRCFGWEGETKLCSKTPVPWPVSCEDNRGSEDCAYWQNQDQCNQTWAKCACRRTCHHCVDKQKYMNATQENKSWTCEDDYPTECQYWKAQGYCNKKPIFMNLHCRRTCLKCAKCQDISDKCDAKALEGACEYDPHWMMKNCEKTCQRCWVSKLDKRNQKPPPYSPFLLFLKSLVLRNRQWIKSDKKQAEEKNALPFKFQ